MTSAPASRYARWTPSTTSGRVRLSRSLSPCSGRAGSRKSPPRQAPPPAGAAWGTVAGAPCRVVTEALAAEVLLAEAMALEHRADGAVQNHDPAGEQLTKADGRGPLRHSAHVEGSEMKALPPPRGRRPKAGGGSLKRSICRIPPSGSWPTLLPRRGGG